MKISAAIEVWLRKQKRGWSLGHAEQVERLARGWCASFGYKETIEVGVEDVERHELSRNDGIRSGSALNQERVYLRQFFKWCRANGWGTSDPTVAWKTRSTVVKREYCELSKEQEEELVRMAPGWLGRFIRVAICTGLREGTIRQLEWSMVKGEELEIPARVMKTRRALVLPVLPKLKEAIGRKQEENQLIFPGLPPAWAVWRAFKSAAKQAGLPPQASPHDLRRTFVARLTEARVPTHTIMGLGGWATMGTLVKHYASRVPEKAAREALAQI